jgi:hypothetical protein
MALPVDLLSARVKCGITVPKRNLCIRMPAGATICANWPLDRVPTALELAKVIFAAINAALAPLRPIFILFDVIIAIFDCILSIPKSIALLNPGPVISCITKLAQLIATIISMLPPISVIVMVADILDVLVVLLQGLIDQLNKIKAAYQRIVTAELRATQLGNVSLQAILDCEKGNLELEIQDMNESLAPLNKLLAVVGLFMSLIGITALNSIGDVPTDLNQLDAAIEQLQNVKTVVATVRSAIPV